MPPIIAGQNLLVTSFAAEMNQYNILQRAEIHIEHVLYTKACITFDLKIIKIVREKIEYRDKFGSESEHWRLSLSEVLLLGVNT